MKNMRFVVLVLCTLVFTHSAFTQLSGIKPVAKKVLDYRSAGLPIKGISPFTKQINPINKKATSAFAKDITFAELNLLTIADVYQAKSDAIALTIPYKNSELILDLVKVNLLADGFKIFTNQSGDIPIAYTPGLYYQGIIKDDPSSLVAISIFENEIMGVVSAANSGNINIGRYKNGFATDYLIYADQDIIVDPNLGTCGTTFDPAYLDEYNEIMQNNDGARDAKCPKIYFEADYDIYVNYGGSTILGTTNYITNLFNNSNAIFTNELVTTEVLTIFIWTTPDTYSDLSSGDKLASFSALRTTYAGDIAHLLAMYGGGGGLASTVNGLCNGYGYCVSWISGAYADYPTYSWPILVITHEMGHLFGSAHTHSCAAWVGGALDNCYPTEGGCPAGPEPIDGGTIMSYCYLTAYGVNFANGFGAQPGDAIRNTIAASYCIDACGVYEYNPYCYTFAFNTESQWIQTVKMSGIANVSGNNGGFGDFTATTFTVTPGELNTIKIVPGYLGTPVEVSIGVWIDFNKDGDFFDIGELVVNASAITSALTTTFLSETGLTGTTRMRVLLKYGGPITTPCDIFFGEAEDYTVSFDVPIIYCASAGIDATNRFIDYVKLVDINRISASDGGYFNGTGITANVMQGSAYTFTYSAEFSAAPEQMYWRAWIDYNIDGDFSDVGERVFQKKATTAANLNKTIVIPATATPGITRLRVSSKFGSYPTPCESFAFGEVEDYTINILPALSANPTQAFEFIIFPNPGTDVFNVAFNNATDGGIIMQLYDITGKIAHSECIDSNNGVVLLNLENIASGLYFVKVTESNGNATIHSLIKQ